MLERILRFPRWVIANISDILLWIGLGVIALLGFKLSRQGQNKLRELENKIEQKQFEKEEIREKIKHLIDNTEARQDEIKELAEKLQESKIEGEKLKKVLKEEFEKTDKIREEGVSDEEKVDNVDDAVNIINDILAN